MIGWTPLARPRQEGTPLPQTTLRLPDWWSVQQVHTRPAIVPSSSSLSHTFCSAPSFLPNYSPSPKSVSPSFFPHSLFSPTSIYLTIVIVLHYLLFLLLLLLLFLHHVSLLTVSLFLLFYYSFTLHSSLARNPRWLVFPAWSAAFLLHKPLSLSINSYQPSHQGYH